MNKILAVAVREYVETIKTKFFLFSIFLTPVLMLAVVLAGPKMMQRLHEGPQPPKMVKVVDRTGVLGDDLAREFASYNDKHPTRQIEPEILGPEAVSRLDEFKQSIRDGALSGCLVVAADIAESGQPSQFYMRIERLADMDCVSAARQALERTMLARRLREHQVAADLYERISKPVVIEQLDVATEGGEGSRVVKLLAPFAFLFLMMMSLFGTSQGMLTSVLEEKSSRVIEILLSSLTPFQLMAGKILGLGAIGLSVLVIWLSAAIGAAAWQGVLPLLSSSMDTVHLVYFVCFFVLGYLLYSSLYAAIGAACNTLKEAQSLMMPVMMAIIIPMSTWMYIAQSPESWYARILSYFPLTAPLVMPVRLTAQTNLPFFEVALTLLGLAGAVLAIMWAAARIFTIGILMYGKPPSVKELFRWVAGY